MYRRWRSWLPARTRAARCWPPGCRRLLSVFFDEGSQRAEGGQRVEVEVLVCDVDTESPVHPAQQQRAGQRVQPDPGPEQRHLLADVGQLRAPGGLGQDLAELGDDLG